MEFITYEQFGAVGNGVADDMPAIVKAHEEANKLNLPVRAKDGATYYLAPVGRTAIVQTSTDWTGAKFIIDDVGVEKYTAPVFEVTSKLEPVEFKLEKLDRGTTYLENPTGKKLHVLVFNANHMDYIRKGRNQNNGAPRRDNFVVNPDGTLLSAVSFQFDEVTEVIANPIPEDKLVIHGGEFTTIANQAESKYTGYARNITVNRSNVELYGITHYVTGELDHGAPYGGFINVQKCSFVEIHDCLFTGHKTYWTIGSAGLPVPMGTYDLIFNTAANVTLARCRQTTDIMDRDYWGLIGSNFTRDFLMEDCVFSRYDAHCGVTNCTLRRCALGHQCLNTIGFGTFLVEDTEAYGNALVGLRSDYGSTWRGNIIIRNSTWKPLGDSRSIFVGHNDGTHDFGYECYMPQNVVIDGLTVIENDQADAEVPLTVFNDYAGLRNQEGESAPEAASRPFMPVPPVSVEVRNIRTERDVQLCAAPELMPDTKFAKR